MNVELLKYVIARAGLTQTQLAEKLNISRQSLSERLNGSIDFKLSEIQTIKDICGLTLSELQDIFFASDVNPQ